MGTMLHNESRRLYSWWWDSHISPKNSKWLQENLTDMDAKVKSMIKLIEEDADSFARRAEMYYKKRPELMKLVEEFYRAYRALAERYDHATVELRHAHRTMAQAFPDQVPFTMGEESQSCSSGPEAEPHTPETSHPIRALLDPDELHKDALGVSSTNLLTLKSITGNSDVSDSATSKRGLKQLSEMLNSEGSGQNFEDGDSEVSSGGQNLKNQLLFESERAVKAETEIQSLKKTLAKVQAEKDTLLFQFQQNVEKLRNAERDLSHAQKDVGRLDERASKAEIEIKILKESLSELVAERDAGLLRIKECLEKISSVETRLSQSQEEGKGQRERAVKAETEMQNLKRELSRLEAEKEAVLSRYKKCLERISDLESKIALAEENARLLSEQVKRSEAEVEELKKALEKMTEEKETAALQYKQCMEIIAMMEAEISRAQANAERLNGEILMGAAKLKSVEDQCAVLESSNRTLQSEADDLLQKICWKDQELSEKNDELKKFQHLVLEENSKFLQVEATLQALKKLHTQSQDDQRALASELKDGLRMLRDVEMCKHGMEEELQQVKDENKSLSELNISSTLSLKSLQDEIISLKEMKEKLEHEVARKEDQSTTLQQEIGNLKEEISGLKHSYALIIKQVDSVGLNPEGLESAVKDLQDENLKLKEACERDSNEKEILYKKLEDMRTLSTDNAILQSSMSGLNVELEGMREKVKKLQESCCSVEGEKSALVAEKAALLSQLQMITENMQKLFEKNTQLESSLGSANAELEQLRMRSKSLEEMCQALNNEKSNLVNERSSLVSQLENVEKRLGKLEMRFTKLEEKYSDLEKEKESTVHQVEELRGSLRVEKQEHSSYMQSTEARLAGLQNDVHVLQEETRLGKKEFEEELDRAVNAQIEIFILQKFVEDLEEKNFSLLIECQKHIDAKKFSDKLISELESENLEQQVEAEFLVNEIEKLSLGIRLVFKALQVDTDYGHEKTLDQEQVSVRSILENIEDLKKSLLIREDEEKKLLVENSVLLSLLGQIGEDGRGLLSEKKNLELEFEKMKGHYYTLQKEKQELLALNKDLSLEMSKRERQEEVLKADLEVLHVKMMNLQGSYVSLKEQNSKVLEENRLLLERLLDLREEKNFLVDESDVIIHEAVALSTLSLVLEITTAEKATELSLLSENLNTLSKANDSLKVETRMLRENLANQEAENVSLKEFVELLGKEVCEVKELNDQMSFQVLLEKDFLRAKSTELSEADEKLKATLCLNGKLCATVEELKMECEELKWNREILEQKILELTEESSNQKEEVKSLNEINNSLETKVGMLCKEIEEHRIREENLSSELQDKTNEFELWEAEASGFYFDLQISTVREVLLENKVHELIEVCESLEEKSSAKAMEIEQINSKVNFLENHVRKLEAKLSAYVPVVASLKENVASLEHNAHLKTKLLKASSHGQKVHHHENSGQEFREYQTPEIPDGVVDLQKMQNTIKAVEKAMMEEMEKLATEAVEKDMEEEVERLAVQETDNNKINAELESDKNGKTAELKLKTENVNLMKDIQLDQVSDCSLYGRSRRKTGGPEDQMLELWEAAEQNRASSSSNDNHYAPSDEMRNQASELTTDIIEPRSRRASEKSFQYSSSELQFEKELGVDKLKRKQGSYKGRILERLASDAQKLTSLQSSVQELKKKIETCSMSDSDNKRGKKANYHDPAEYEIVQRQLFEVEEAVVQLVDVNDRLTKDVEESRPSLSDGKSVTEQACKGAEKIGQLQFEVQNIQYILLKLDQGVKSQGKASRFTGVLLRDFIYSSRRRRQRQQKKSCLCGCAKPKTRED